MAGLAVGAGLLGALLVASIIGVELLSSGPNVEVSVDGAAVSAHGGARIMVRDDRGGQMEARCRGACDDIAFTAKASDKAYAVQVLDPAGKCLACSPAAYVTHGTSTRWRVGGRQELVVTTERAIQR